MVINGRMRGWLVGTLAFGWVTKSAQAILIGVVTVNGGTSVTVAPGAIVSVSVTSTLVLETWGSSSTTIGPLANVCHDHPNHSGTGVFTEVFNVVVPVTPGNYTLTVQTSTNDSCSAASGTSQVLPGAVIVLADSDGDGVPDTIDGCPNDPNKIAPGACGCGAADTDSDLDGTPNCNDGCPFDPLKTSPGTCGCGAVDVPGCGGVTDQCPNDPNKIDPGVCGCGVPDVDSDGDGVLDCNDGCPNDSNKTAPGLCGCGNPEIDSDGDGTVDCLDGCPNDPDKVALGACGCGQSDIDTDGDGTPDCLDGCPNDPHKTAPGTCGCGTTETAGCNQSSASGGQGKDGDPNSVEADDDGDGISNLDENSGPNAGDGNSDGIPDSQQANVATIKAMDGSYLTLVAPSNASFHNVKIMDNPSPNNSPAGAEFPLGFVSFGLGNLAAAGVTVAIEMILSSPRGESINAFIWFGPMPDEAVPGWHQLTSNNDTSLSIQGLVANLQLVDGKGGDVDRVADGVISVLGAPAIYTPGCGAGMCGGGLMTIAPASVVSFTLIRRRRRNRRHARIARQAQ